MHARMRAVVTMTLGFLMAVSLSSPSSANATRTIRPVAVNGTSVFYSLSSIKHRRVVAAEVRLAGWRRAISVGAVRRAARTGRPLRVRVPAALLAKAEARARAKAKAKARTKAKAKAKAKATPSPTPATAPAAPATTTIATSPALPDVPLVITVQTSPAPGQSSPVTPSAPSSPSTPPVPAIPSVPDTPAAGLPGNGDDLPDGLGSWRVPGSEPLSDQAAAALVRASPELRPENQVPNQRVPTSSEIADFHDARYLTGSNAGRLGSSNITTVGDVSGNFEGTTDEILQWASYKWGIPLEVVRAIAKTESQWRMSQLGDATTVDDASQYPAYSRISSTRVYQSLGIMQVKWDAEGTLHVGTNPLRYSSTAFNVDYWAANIRFFYDGGASLWFGSGGSYVRGDEWLSIGAWFNPTPWKNADQLGYITTVKGWVASHPWTADGF